MAYQEPGVTQSQQLSPQNLTTSPIPNLLAIVGIAPRVRTAFNEATRRGLVRNEALTFSGITPFLATLAHKANRRQQDSILLRNGTDVMPNEGWKFLSATILSLVETFNVPASAYVTLAIDGKPFISIAIPPAALQTAAVVAASINAALNASPLYGPAYGAVATVVGNRVLVTSPSTNVALSDVRFLTTPPDTAVGAVDVTALIFGVAPSFIATTQIQLLDAFYDPTATYTLTYIAVDTIVDPLLNTGITSITKIGNVPGVTDYKSGTDYVLSGNTVDWTPNTEAQVTAPAAGPYVIVAGVNDKLLMSINSLPVKTITFPAGAIPAFALATVINQALLVDPDYGPVYGSVASDVGGKLVIQAPSPFLDLPGAQGVNSLIEFFATPANAVTSLFGIQQASLPYMATGTAKQPAVGATYYVSYTFARPAVDYNNASSVGHLFLNETDALAYTGALTPANVGSNKLAIAASLAFDNNAPRVLLIQVDDSVSPGFPSVNQVNAAINAARDNSGITDIVVLDPRLAVQTYLLDHVTTASSIQEKSYRLGWYGMARNSPVGDIDTPDTYVYRAKVTLQTAPDSPGRGRSILCAPPNVSRTVRYSDATEALINLDGTYLATAIAARKCSFLNPAAALLRKTLIGLDVDTFQTYQKGERTMLLSNGVTVVAPKGGRLEIVDALTTEQGAGNVVEFIEPSAMSQKDAVVRVVDQVLDENVVGIVPTDLADYINDIKGYIQSALQSCIDSSICGRYVDGNGNPRNLNLSTDIQVYQAKGDPRKYFFRYWFNLRYPGKIFEGLWSVDAPFQPDPQQAKQSA